MRPDAYIGRRKPFRYPRRGCGAALLSRDLPYGLQGSCLARSFGLWASQLVGSWGCRRMTV